MHGGRLKILTGRTERTLPLRNMRNSARIGKY